MKHKKRGRFWKSMVLLFHPRRGLHKWQTLVLTWGSLIWAVMVLFVEREWEPSANNADVERGILLSAKPPPLTRKIPSWTELYSANNERRRRTEQGSVKPRTFPGNYNMLSHRHAAMEPISRRPISALKELRRLSSYPPNCKPKSEWHSYSFPTCNSLHELDMRAGVIPPSTSMFDEDSMSPDSNELYMEYKFAGGSRESWLVNTLCTDGSDCVAPGLNATEGKTAGPHVILRTLNWPMEHDEVVYEHQRIDALVAERLTSSPHVIDIYGFCGMSALNEYANGGSFGKMVRRMTNETSMSPKELLVYARDAALSLAAIHEIDGRGNVTTVVHHDVSAKNFLTVDGKLKVADFNDAKLLGWDTTTGKRCHGFSWDGLCGTNRERTHRRAPEECMGDAHRRMTTEKVEVFHLGAFFFYLLTGGGWPFQFELSRKGVEYKLQAPAAKEAIVKGHLPRLPEEVGASNSSAIKILRQAMKWTYTFDPKRRPSARAVADFLVNKTSQFEEDAL